VAGTGRGGDGQLSRAESANPAQQLLRKVRIGCELFDAPGAFAVGSAFESRLDPAPAVFAVEVWKQHEAHLLEVRRSLAFLGAHPAPIVGRDVEAVLETERLTLRQFTPDDADNLVELDGDPEVMRYINGGRPTSREEIECRELPAFLEYYARSDRYGFWAAVEKATGDFIGWFHLRPRPDGAADEPELGYRLRRPAWGKGYATEGSRALIERAFTDLGAQRVWAETLTVNTASRRVMEKSGLKYVRTFHQDWPDKIEGDEEGDVEFALTRAEWEERQSRAS
jgi:RimJ/RimL family protein N-acetyltransferase